MPDATIAWFCIDATYNIEAIYNFAQQKFKSHSTSKGHWFEPAVNHYFFSHNVRLLASRSLPLTTNSQNDWSMTNQKGYTGLRQDSYL